MGETAEIEFYGAALGDDVGIVCPAAGPGDLGIAPIDPGGPAFARLFRVEGDGLAPRRATDDDGLLDELMRRAADAARAATGAAARAVAERAAGLKGRRDKFVASLNGALARAEVAARFEPPGLWDALEPLAQASFAALVIGETGPARARLQQLGGYGAFCADPALAAGIAEGGEFAQSARLSAEAAPARSAPSLLARYLDACGAQGMAPAGVDATQEARLMRALLKEPDVAALREARVALAIDDGVRREAAKAARLIVDAAAVERARAHFAEAGATDAADMLDAYLDVRRAGGWTPPHEAPNSRRARRARRRRTRRRAARSRKPRAGAAGSGAVEGIICCDARLIWTLMAKAARLAAVRPDNRWNASRKAKSPSPAQQNREADLFAAPPTGFVARSRSPTYVTIAPRRPYEI